MIDHARRADELVAACDRLAGACALPIDLTFVRELAKRCGWGTRSTTAPLLPSGVSHGVPWGLSIALEPSTVELRLFLEAQHDPASPETYRQAASDVSAFAAARGAQLDRLHRLIDGAPASCRLWHAVTLAPGPPRWHAYLCVPPDRDVARAALHRVGAGMPRLRDRDRISIVSLDLAAAMRVKAYVLMPDASLSDLAAIHDDASGAVAGDAQRFGIAMLGDDRPIWWLAAAGFAGPSSSSCALHLGVPRHLDEAMATTRLRHFLRELSLPEQPWERARAALGAHHFITFQRRAGAPRVTAYFLPEVRR